MTGRPTESAVAATRATGTATAASMKQAAEEATAAGIPESQTPVVAERLSLLRRFGLLGSKGQITGDFKQQALEDSLRNADVTSKAGNIMRNFDDAARAKMVGVDGSTGYGKLSTEVGGKVPVGDVEDAGQVVAKSIRDKAAALKGEVRAAYETAKAKGAGVRQGSVRNFIDDVQTSLRDEFIYDPQLQPKTAQIISTLRGIDTAIGSGELPKTAIPIQRVEGIRKLISRSLRDQNVSPDDAAALQHVMRKFDDWADGLVTSGKLTGDKTALEAFKTARGLRAQYGAMFQKPNPRVSGGSDVSAGKFIENLVQDESLPGYQLVARAVNEPALAARVLSVVGRDGPEHLALKQGALEKVFTGALKDDQLSPQRFITLYEQAFHGKTKGAMNVIFNGEDREAINAFANAMKVLVTNPNATNPSKTGYKIAQMAQQLLQKVGIVSAASGNLGTAAAASGIQYLSNRAGVAAAREATRGLVPRPNTAPYAAAVVGGTEALRDADL